MKSVVIQCQLWGWMWGWCMVRGKNKLTAMQLRSAAEGVVQDGGGLFLDKRADGGKWTYRYSIAGRRRDMGLGSFPQVSLAAARQERDKWAAVLQGGLDPITERQRRVEAEAAAALDKGPTVEELVNMAFESLRPTLRDEGKRGRWLSPLRVHILPKIGKRRVGSLDQADIRDVLAPIWFAKPETARKASTRLRMAFELGRLARYPIDPFIVDIARQLLGKRPKRKHKHIASTAWQDVPDLYARLCESHTASHLCLRLIILTAVRGDAARGARVEEIEGDVWTVPADRIKGREGHVSDFRVPLSTAALEVIEMAKAVAVDGFLFPARKRTDKWGGITANALEKALTTLGEPGRPHGFRTSFRTWVQDQQTASYDVAETALGHIVGSEVERSYARSDLLDQRRLLMIRWANFVTGSESKVIELRRV
ncbi:integrase arm-type DNA-binding domain-containing protein [Tabrizicola sp. J26]|uniref:tyrosine-type recombinase/integrase n=1 Tax=Alitabrizicola rongguiensis TaxID=2909234 RepID=UPI001F2C2120|nr:site-specific integrase [Tabrizicola rongguiensis]MCF1708275.1 integrase arm-type DNA-binding domain-containing protein [Tabrizicola rongguiensis]